jgi:hypothetical protein
VIIKHHNNVRTASVLQIELYQCRSTHSAHGVLTAPQHSTRFVSDPAHDETARFTHKAYPALTVAKATLTVTRGNDKFWGTYLHAKRPYPPLLRSHL